MDKVKEFAKKQGYDDVIYLREWNGFKVYEPVFEGEGVAYIGPPLVVLVKGENIRMSSVEEAFEIS